MSRSGAPPFVAKKSNSDGAVSINVELRCQGWRSDRARITGSADITTEQARALAHALIELANKADAKVASKVAGQERRQKWREREIAAGRMVVFGGLGK